MNSKVISIQAEINKNKITAINISIFSSLLEDIIYIRDEQTSNHCSRISRMVKPLLKKIIKDELYKSGTELDKKIFSELDIYTIKRIIRIHDLGKVAISDDILRKPERFDENDISIMQEHTIKGQELIAKTREKHKNLLKKLPMLDLFFAACEQVVLNHHEKWDGTGYPNGLSGTQIPLIARITTIVDVTDALLSRRFYKEKIAPEEVLKTIKQEKGTSFDPTLSDILINNWKNILNIHLTHKDHL